MMPTRAQTARAAGASAALANRGRRRDGRGRYKPGRACLSFSRTELFGGLRSRQNAAGLGPRSVGLCRRAWASLRLSTNSVGREPGRRSDADTITSK
jgi:hypothetical protein